MPKDKKKPIQSRVFTASLQPVWEQQKIDEFCKSMTGVAEVYVVNHDKDINDDGELKEAHTHLLLIYDTPRRLNTIANVLQVAPNFVEYGRSKNALMLYLTHRNEPTKFQYPDEVVFTNSTPYKQVVKGLAIGDSELIEQVLKGNELSLIGTVSLTRIRLAQSVVQNKALANANTQLALLREQNAKIQSTLDLMSSGVAKIENYFTEFYLGLKELGEGSKKIGLAIANEIKMLRTIKR